MKFSLCLSLALLILTTSANCYPSDEKTLEKKDFDNVGKERSSEKKDVGVLEGGNGGEVASGGAIKGGSGINSGVGSNGGDNDKGKKKNKKKNHKNDEGNKNNGSGSGDGPTVGAGGNPGGSTKNSSATIPYGKCTAGLPQIAGSVQVTEPRIIDKTGFDCENKLYYNPSSKAETIIFILKNGASLTNCYFKQSGESDAVHVEGNGNFKLSNLRFITIGDEAISIKGGGDVSIDHCVFVNGGNKAVQHDGTGSVTVNNSCFQYLHICMKSCGNCPQNVDKPRRTITSTSCSFYNVRTVMGCNINNGDVCTVSNPMGDSPSESICTTYDGISDSSRLPTQVSKNKRNPSCIF